MSDKISGLPKQFNSLQPFVSDWARENEYDRSVKRYSSSIDEIKIFYNAMLPKMEECLTLLSNYQIDDMPIEVFNLYRLCLMFADIASAVEQFNSVRVPDTILDPMHLMILHKDERGIFAT